VETLFFCTNSRCGGVWRNHMWVGFRSKAVTGHFTWLETWVYL